MTRVGGGGGFTVNSAVCLANPKIAVIVTVRGTVTIEVVMVKVCKLCPAGMITGATWAAVSMDCSVTVAPVTGAGSPSITVPVTGFPPTTALESSTSCSGGSRLSTAVELRRPSVAVRVTVSTLVTG